MVYIKEFDHFEVTLEPRDPEMRRRRHYTTRFFQTMDEVVAFVAEKKDRFRVKVSVVENIIFREG